MARSRRTTPSAQASVPAATELAGRTRTSTALAPATQPAQTRRLAGAKDVESNASVTSHASRTRRRVNAPQEILQVGE